MGVGAPALLELLEDLGAVDASVRYERRGADRGPRGLWRTARRCARFHPRRALIFPPSFRAALLAFLSSCPHRRGHPVDGRRFLLSDPYPQPSPPRSRHQAEVWWAMAKGVELDETPPQAAPLVPGKGSRRALGALRARMKRLAAPGRYAVLAPAVRYGPAKQWPANNFAVLSQKLVEEMNLQVVVVAGAGSEEAGVAEAVEHAAAVVNLAGQTDLLALSGLLHEAALFVGNDSGPAHLAAALGTPTVTIFGSTNPIWTAPRGERVRIVGPHPVPCSPCYLKSCPIGLPCLEELGVEQVFQEVLELVRGESASDV